MLPTYTFLTEDIFHLFMVFFRLFPIVWLFPGFGMAATPANIRLTFTIMLAFALFSFISPVKYPDHLSLGMGYLLKEMVIGFFIGGCFAATFQILDSTGSLIAQQIGLGNTTLFNPILENTVSLPSILLAFSSLSLLFILDIHHHIIKAFFFSYQQLSIDNIPWETVRFTFIEYTIKLASTGFSMALKMAGPFIIANIFLHAALGILNRLVPSIHVFFLSQPLQISLGLIVFLGTIKGALDCFVQFFSSIVTVFHQG